MHILDAFHNTVHGAPGGCEALAARLNMSAQVLRNKANPNSTTNHVTFVEVDRIMGLTGDHQALHALAKNHGYVCVRVEEGMQSDLSVLEMVAQVMAAEGEVGTELNAALADGRIMPAELERVREAVKKVERSLEGMVARLAGMAER